MGYSMSVNCKSEKAQAEMMAFLKQNFRSWVLLTTGKDEPRYVSEPRTKLSYAHAKLQVGFDFSGLHGLEREYYTTVLRWMALQAGAVRTSFKDNYNPKDSAALEEAVPYWVYDGTACDPVLLKKPTKKRLLWFWVNELGMKLDPKAVAEDHGSDYYFSHLCKPYKPPKGEKKPKSRGMLDFKVVLREDAEALLRKTRSDAGLSEDTGSITLEEIQLLYRTLLPKEADTFFAPIRNEMQRLNDLWKAQP
jgi:hypothetical protein